MRQDLHVLLACFGSSSALPQIHPALWGVIDSASCAMPGPVLPNAAVRGNEGYSDGKCSPKSMPKDLRSPGRQVPRYRSAMMECSPRSQKSGKSGKGSPEKKQTRRQRTAMLLADGTPKATANAARMEHSRTAMLVASKSVAADCDDGTQSTGSLVSFVQGKMKGFVESVRHRN